MCGCVRIILGSEDNFSTDLMFLVWMGHIVSLKFLQLILAVHFVMFSWFSVVLIRMTPREKSKLFHIVLLSVP